MPHKDSDTARAALREEVDMLLDKLIGEPTDPVTILLQSRRFKFTDAIVEACDRYSSKRAVEEVERYADYLVDLDNEAAFEQGWQEYAYKRIREIDGEE